MIHLISPSAPQEGSLTYDHWYKGNGFQSLNESISAGDYIDYGDYAGAFINGEYIPLNAGDRILVEGSRTPISDLVDVLRLGVSVQLLVNSELGHLFDPILPSHIEKQNVCFDGRDPEEVMKIDGPAVTAQLIECAEIGTVPNLPPGWTFRALNHIRWLTATYDGGGKHWDKCYKGPWIKVKYSFEDNDEPNTVQSSIINLMPRTHCGWCGTLMGVGSCCPGCGAS